MQQDSDPFVQQAQAGRMQGTKAQAPTELYRRAYRFFDKEYTVQPSSGSGTPTSSSSSANVRTFGDEQQQHRFERAPASRNGSELSHEDSLPSCSRSQASTQASSSSDAASAWSAEGSLPRANAFPPTIVTADSFRADAFLTPSPVAAVLQAETSPTPKGQRNANSSEKSDTLSIPSVPSFPSFNSSLTATRADHIREIRRRPSTADVYSQASQVSSNAFASRPLPPSLPMVSPTEPVRYEVCSYNTAPGPWPVPTPTSQSASKPSAFADKVEAASKSTTSRLLRARVASTPKLRLDASSLFPSEQALHGQPPVPALPAKLGNVAGDRRPSTSQMDGRAPFFGRRFRSRTLGESDRTEAINMHTAVENAARSSAASASAQRPLFAASMSSAGLPQRHPSQVSASSSGLHSPLYSMQPTPGSSICSASSPATTNSSLPVTPRTTTTFPRPKSRGTTNAAKSGGAGWASYLNSGLTLHLEQDHGRAIQINMTYLAYDPFGRPEQLVEGTEAARTLTPKRPKSRGDKDQEAEQSGTLEFGPSDEMRVEAYSFDVSRKSEGSALLKHLTVGDDTKADLLTRQAALSVKTLGNQQVSGYERKGRLAWKFVYRVEQDGPYTERRRLVPVRFSCSATLLNPERARKSRLLNLVKKQMVPTLASKAVAAGSIDSPHSGPYPYEDACATVAASPASSRRSNKQLGVETQLPASPVRRNNGNIGSIYNSPLRQTSRSITSADSSFCSQPTTPGRDSGNGHNINADTSLARLHLQASPVSAQFGGQRHLRPNAPALQLDMGAADASRRLQEKASMQSLSAKSSISSGSVQMAKPMMINGRKLIPISLPAGLARKTKIDPALLQASAKGPIANSTQQQFGMQPSLPSPASDRQRSTSMHSSASSSDRAPPTRCLLSSQPRTGNSSSTSSRPPTASETIKAEYLARTNTATESQQSLRPQKSFTGAILTPSSFAADTGRQRRQRSRTIEAGLGGDGFRRPFTADAWGESQYPTREQISTVRAFSQQHSMGPGEVGKIVPREVLANFGGVVEAGRGKEQEMWKALPAPPPRQQSRPRTAQTITAT